MAAEEGHKYHDTITGDEPRVGCFSTCNCKASIICCNDIKVEVWNDIITGASPSIDRMVRVYDLWKPTRLLCKVETAPNPRGLCCLLCESTVMTTVRGQVRVEHLEKEMTRFITAHSSDVVCMAMTVEGTVLATASVKGALIRVFSTVDGTWLCKRCAEGVTMPEI